MEDFNFDYWKELYEKDPEEFEVEITTFLEDEIVRILGGDNPTPKQEQQRAKIRGILWKRQLEYRKLGSVERFNRVVKHFYEDLEEFRCALQ